MKNPMNRRILREFRGDLGKYLVIFVFMVLMISAVSGFLVADNSFEYLYNRGFTDQKIEDGHFSFKTEAPQEVLNAISEKSGVSIHRLFYFEENLKDTDKTIRVYSSGREVNLPSILSGEIPTGENEIALDRMFADNNGIKAGDSVVLKDQTLRVSGLIALPDYSCLFEKNTDMMFDSINFSVALMTEEGFQKFGSNHVTWNYAWLYPETIARTDKESAKKRSDELIEVFEEVIREYDESLVGKNILSAVGNALKDGDVLKAADSVKDTEILEINDYLPRYLNQAINFTGDDMGSDKAMFLVFDYLLTLVLAFVFAVTTSNTIAKEAGVIGTLRASGYTRAELVSHYMVLPVLISLLAGVVGNIFGYTLVSSYMVSIYYGSYSFPKYEALWNMDAFVLTTVVPIVLMFLINLIMLHRKLKLSPLRFLRHDLGGNGKKRAFRLNRSIPFLHRFRMRILFQNIPNYVTLFCGIFIGGTLMVFGTMFGPLLNDYKDLIINDRICEYQYVLMREAETADDRAEKYSLTSLATTKEGYKEDEVSVFGIVPDSAYINADISDGSIAVSRAFAEKFQLGDGDSFVLKDPYNSSKTYEFTVGSVYDYSAGMAVFMTRSDYVQRFGGKESAFTGYFSNRELADLNERDVAAVITASDLTKASDQLTVSMGEMMILIRTFGVIVFVLLMFLMSRQIIEKNAKSISMTKILGFSDREIGKLYIVATSVVVVLSLLITIPLVDGALRLVFSSYIYTEMTGYIPYIVSGGCYVRMAAAGLISYAAVAAAQLFKISRIPKSDALKDSVE